MKKISAETTRYMMDAMAYAFVAATVVATGEEPTDEEIDSHVRSLMALYCRSEGIEPTYDNIASSATAPDCYACCKRTEADDWHDDDDDDEDSWQDEDEDEDNWDDDDEEDYEGEDGDVNEVAEKVDEYRAILDRMSPSEILTALACFFEANKNGK